MEFGLYALYTFTPFSIYTWIQSCSALDVRQHLKAEQDSSTISVFVASGTTWTELQDIKEDEFKYKIPVQVQV